MKQADAMVDAATVSHHQTFVRDCAAAARTERKQTPTNQNKSIDLINASEVYEIILCASIKM